MYKKNLFYITSKIQNGCLRFGISYTDYIRTTEERHAKAVEMVWQRLEVTYLYSISLISGLYP